MSINFLYAVNLVDGFITDDMSRKPWPPTDEKSSQVTRTQVIEEKVPNHTVSTIPVFYSEIYISLEEHWLAEKMLY